MARKLRYVPQSRTLVSITNRTIQGRYLFRPGPSFNDLFLGTLGRTQRLHQMAIAAVTALSNHFHLLLIVDDAAQVGHTVATLEAQKAQSVQAFKAATSDVMRTMLESDAEELERQIEQAKTVRNALEVSEDDVELFVREAKKIMEHPSILLENPVNIRQQQMLYSLVFEEYPTYDEIANGTPKLHWIFYISSESTTPESLLVRLRGIEWNLIESTMVHWREVFKCFRI